MNVTTNEEHLHFINFMKLIEESNTSEVLGSFSADHAASFTVSKNLKTNELSLAFQKDGNPIYSLIGHMSTCAKYGDLLMTVGLKTV